MNKLSSSPFTNPLISYIAEGAIFIIGLRKPFHLLNSKDILAQHFSTSTYCFEIDFENSGENYYSVGKLFRCSRNKKWSNLWVLSWAILGHHLHHKNSTTNCLLFFQFDRSVCSNCLNGCSRLHFTTWLRREIVIR